MATSALNIAFGILILISVILIYSKKQIKYSLVMKTSGFVVAVLSLFAIYVINR